MNAFPIDSQLSLREAGVKDIPPSKSTGKFLTVYRKILFSVNPC